MYAIPFRLTGAMRRSRLVLFQSVKGHYIRVASVTVSTDYIWTTVTQRPVFLHSLCKPSSCSSVLILNNDDEQNNY